MTMTRRKFTTLNILSLTAIAAGLSFKHQACSVCGQIHSSMCVEPIEGVVK